MFVFFSNMKITRFRSLWGIDTGYNLDNWGRFLPELKTQGYSMFRSSRSTCTTSWRESNCHDFAPGGIEVDIHALNPEGNFKRLREICDQLDFEIVVLSVLYH